MILSDKTFVEALFVLYDHKEEGVLNQSAWLDELKQRENDFVALLETVAYLTCKEEDISKHSLAMILDAKGVNTKLVKVIGNGHEVDVETFLSFWKETFKLGSSGEG